jgi:hypothetical protein
MGDRGLYPKTTARFRASAVETLTSVLGRDEPQDLSFIFENLDELGKRWATLKDANPKTVATYVSRARTALDDYFQYQDHPSSFQGRRRKTKGKARKNSSTSNKPEVRNEAPHDELPERPSGARPSVPLRSFPLEGDEDFKYALPSAGITVREALRVFYHLVTLARDFDPTDPKQVKIFSLVKPSE